MNSVLSELVCGNLKVAVPIGFWLGQSASMQVDLKRMQHPVRQAQNGVAFLPHPIIIRLHDAAREMLVQGLLFGNRAFPRRAVAAFGPVVCPIKMRKSSGNAKIAINES